MESGTGFMMFRRDTLLKVKEDNPNIGYRPDHARSDRFDGSVEISAFFDCSIDPETKRYLSEDYHFCVPKFSRIQTEDGFKTIGEIVHTKYNGKVASVNANGQIEYKRVVGWSKIRNSNKRMGRISTKRDAIQTHGFVGRSFVCDVWQR